MDEEYIGSVAALKIFVEALSAALRLEPDLAKSTAEFISGKLRKLDRMEDITPEAKGIAQAFLQRQIQILTSPKK